LRHLISGELGSVPAMDGATVFIVIGTALQVGGLIALGIGVTQTRKAYLPDREGWWTRLRRRLVKMMRSLSQRVKRQRDATVHVSALHASVGATAAARGRIARTHWPDNEAERWEEVRFRTDRNLEKIQDAEDRITDHDHELQTVRREIEEARADLVGRSEQEVAQLAASGLRTESVSVFLIALGLLLTTVGSLMGN
jgi:hypothetical protein